MAWPGTPPESAPGASSAMATASPRAGGFGRPPPPVPATRCRPDRIATSCWRSLRALRAPRLSLPCTFCSRLLQGRPMRRKDLTADRRVERAVRRDGVRSVLHRPQFHLGRPIARCATAWPASGWPNGAVAARARPKTTSWPPWPRGSAGWCTAGRVRLSRAVAELDKVGSVEGMAAGVRRILSHGMEVLCFFILGFPGETERDRADGARGPDLNQLRLVPRSPHPHGVLSVPARSLFVPATHPDALPASSRRCASARISGSTRPRYTPSRLARRGGRSGVRRIFASQWRLAWRSIWRPSRLQRGAGPGSQRRESGGVLPREQALARLVLDNGSTDATAAIADRLAGHGGGARHPLPRRAGQAAARVLASGEVIGYGRRSRPTSALPGAAGWRRADFIIGSAPARSHTTRRLPGILSRVYNALSGGVSARAAAITGAA